MSATTKTGTVAQAGTARTWAPAALACMGVVFGDIGTSPLYTLSAAASAVSPAGDVSPQAVLGIVSLIFWSLIIVISIKYAILIMRADNHGEGGILALLALISPRRAKKSRRRALMVVVCLIGAALLYGDGTITPAISVLSAIEGIKVYAPQLHRVVVPLTVIILALLFTIQRNGTSWIGGIFGPIMLIWFGVTGVLGIMGIARTPAVLAALSPLPAITYLWHAGPLALVVMGSEFRFSVHTRALPVECASLEDVSLKHSTKKTSRSCGVSPCSRPLASAAPSSATMARAQGAKSLPYSPIIALSRNCSSSTNNTALFARQWRKKPADQKILLGLPLYVNDARTRSL